jgi:hypothetical protein
LKFGWETLKQVTCGSISTNAPMHEQPSCAYAYCQEIQDGFLKNKIIQTFCVFPSLLVMHFPYHVL